MEKLPKQIKLFARAGRMVWQAQPRLALTVMITAILSALSAPLLALITKIIVDRLTLTSSTGANSSFISVLLPSLLLMVLWAVTQIVNASSAKLRSVLSDKASWYIKHRLVEKSTQLDFSYYESSKFYDQIELCKGQTWRFSAIVMQFPEVLLHLISTISFFILLFSINPLFPIILIAVTIPKMIVNGHFTRKKAELYLENVPNERMLQYMTALLSEKTWAKEIRLFGLQSHFLNKHKNASTGYLESLGKIFSRQERSNLLLTLLSLMGTAGIWIYTTVKTIQMRTGLGNVALVFQSTQQLQQALNQFVFFGSYFLEHAIYLDQVFEFLDTEPGVITSQQTRKEMSLVEGGGNLTIEFRNVSFQYPGTENFALKNISFKLHPLEKCALVGENGAGKTTLVKLLTRLYDPTEGEILINNVNLKEISPEDWHQSLSVVFQDFFHYDLTIREDIGFGKIDMIDNTEAIRYAANAVGLSEKVVALPLHYETMVGKQFENADGTAGTDFSGGEWQKVALARVFLRAQSQPNSLFIFDEPTAALDVKAEKEFFEQVSTLMNNGTTLFVTHRLSSVKMAENILVLKNGHLIESGDHQTLMKADGEYATMFNLQAERYLEKEEEQHE